MKHVLVLGALMLWQGLPSHADVLELKDGRKIEWLSLKDCGDSYEVETPERKKVNVKKDDVAKFVQSQRIALTGASMTWERPKGVAAANLLALVDTKRDAVSGDWKVNRGSLVCPTTASASRIAVPHVPPEEYDIEATVELREGSGEIIIGLVAAGKQFGIYFADTTGIVAVDGKFPFENETGVPGRVFSPKKPRTVTCSVRKETVSVYVDAKRILQWNADYKRVSLAVGYLPPSKDHLFVSVANGTYAISQLTLFPRK